MENRDIDPSTPTGNEYAPSADSPLPLMDDLLLHSIDAAAASAVSDRQTAVAFHSLENSLPTPRARTHPPASTSSPRSSWRIVLVQRSPT